MSDRDHAERIAAILADAFDAEGQRWSTAEVRDLLAQTGVHAVLGTDGCALVRVVADEAELLSIAVERRARRKGFGAALLGQAIDLARKDGASRIFLEVAADNGPARTLYRTRGFIEVGRRPAYYLRPDGTRADALILEKSLA